MARADMRGRGPTLAVLMLQWRVKGWGIHNATKKKTRHTVLPWPTASCFVAMVFTVRGVGVLNNHDANRVRSNVKHNKKNETSTLNDISSTATKNEYFLHYV